MASLVKEVKAMGEGAGLATAAKERHVGSAIKEPHRGKRRARDKAGLKANVTRMTVAIRVPTELQDGKSQDMLQSMMLLMRRLF
jgi:hypothetical protein